MKAFHRIRRNLILLLFMLHTAHSAPQKPDLNKDDKSLTFAVHTKCVDSTDDTNSYFTPNRKAEIQLAIDKIKNNQCTRYLILRARELDQVEIEFRDDTAAKIDGAEFRSTSDVVTFKCMQNVPSTIGSFGISGESPPSASDKVYCKFLATAKNAEKSILTVLPDNSLAKIVFGTKVLPITGLSITRLKFPCGWNKPLFANANFETTIREDEETADLTTSDTERTCEYYNWYSESSSSDPNEWKRINNKFTCAEGKITTTNMGGTIEPLNFDIGFTKCTRPKCSTCPPLKGSTANFTNPDDGKSCVTITCPKAMLIVATNDVPFPHSNKTLQCSTESTTSIPKWEGYTEEIKNVTCVDDVSCQSLDHINSKCPEKIPEGKNCTEAQLNNTINPAVCAQDQEIWFTPHKTDIKRQVETFKCDTTSGRWKVTNMTSVTNGNVYCLKEMEKKEEVVMAPQKGSAGQLIGIICGVAIVAVIIIIVFVLCARRHFQKKGNRDEMKSVSVTGKGDKKSKKKKDKKDKKSKSSSSATSEISAPPPPPCPDSLPGLQVEPDLPRPSAPPPPTPAACPSSGGAGGKEGAAAAVPIVGPDTGKPDKPAELIDIKPQESEKKTEKESSRKSDKDKQEATLVNTVTGTQSGAEPVKNDATSTKKTDKNGESSDTGRNTKTGTKTKKDIKKQVDKHGRGLTDDDDYNIDEGAKPVSHVDKNKKPYAPAVDPRKKMINVTMTEDEEGHLKPRGKDSPF